MSDDVNLVHDIIINVLTDALNKVAPLKQFSTRQRPTPLYLQRDTLEVMAARYGAAKSGAPNYRQLRNMASHLVRRDSHCSARAFVSGVVNSSGNSAARLWKLTNTVLGRVSPPLPCLLIGLARSPVTEPRELADTMNKFFISKISKLRDAFSASEVNGLQVTLGSWQASQADSLILSPPSTEEVIRAMTSLKKTDACGVDGITVSVLQLAAPIIAMPVAHLIALSFAQAKVPSAFKAAIVVPIHKGKGKPSNQPSSYRPVAILPALSKVLEKIVLWQLTPFLENKLPECQFGFRPAWSSFSAVATAHGAWARATTAGHVTGVAAFDLTAAFDTVDHDILYSKLAGLGIQNRSLNWFRHYLEGRHQ